MPTPFFEPILRDALLSLRDDEVVVVDHATKAEIQSAQFLDDLRFADNAFGRSRAVGFLGADRAALRARRIQDGSRPRLVSPEEAATGLEPEVRGFVVANSANELLTTARLSAALPGRPVHSFKNEIHPAVCVPGDFDEQLRRLSHPLPPSGSIAILAVMRTGSYLVAELATNLGLGRPQEHLKDAIVDAVRGRDRRDMSFRVWWESLEATHRSPTGWFGTKLISHYVERLRAVLLQSESAWFDSRIRSARLVTLVRRDQVRQAVSAYRAMTTGVYRARSDSEQNKVHKADVPYDLDSLLERYRFLGRQNDFMRDYVDEAHMGVKRLDLIYEDMTTDLAFTAERLSTFAGVEFVPPPEHPKNRPLTPNSTSTMVEQFRRDLKSFDERSGRPARTGAPVSLG